MEYVQNLNDPNDPVWAQEAWMGLCRELGKLVDDEHGVKLVTGVKVLEPMPNEEGVYPSHPTGALILRFLYDIKGAYYLNAKEFAAAKNGDNDLMEAVAKLMVKDFKEHNITA